MQPILGTFLACKMEELNVEIDGMRPPQEADVLMVRETMYRNKNYPDTSIFYVSIKPVLADYSVRICNRG